jgi:monoamine oxidase
MRLLGRRHTLRLLGALPLSVAACGGSQDSTEAGDNALSAKGGNFDVVIVGAGMAGLRAAQVLTAAGKSVVILEARDRIGGRVHTDRTGFGIPIELGASWIHDSTTNPLTPIAKAAGVKTPASDYSERVWREGVLSEEKKSDAANKAFLAQLDKATRSSKDPAESIRAALTRTVGTLSDDAREDFEWQLVTNVEYDFGSDAEHISASRYNDGSDKEEHNLIVVGYDGVVAAVGKSAPVRTGETVTRIAQTAKGVEVHSTSGVFIGKRAIVTLSVGVLKAGSVEFSPALSEKKKEILGRLDMGVLSKTFLRFPKVFWPLESDFLGRISPLSDRGNWSEWINIAKFIGTPVLAAFNGGKHARSVEASSDQDIVRDAMAALRTAFPDAPDPIGILQTKWSQDPLALGSYSYLPVGSLADDRKNLGESEGAISFAGEACNVDHAQTAHGAYLSGEAAAKAILKG